jgi:hypothetical protein
VAFSFIMAENRIAEHLPIALSRSDKGGCAQIASFGIALAAYSAAVFR